MLPGLRLTAPAPAAAGTGCAAVVLATPISEAAELVRPEPGGGGRALFGGGPGDGDAGDAVLGSGLTRSGISSGSSWGLLGRMGDDGGVGAKGLEEMAVGWVCCCFCCCGGSGAAATTVVTVSVLFVLELV